MLGALFNAIAKGLGIVDNFTDPDKRTKAFVLLRQKNIKRALDTSEDIIELMDKHINELPITTQNKYKALRKRFNDYD